MSLSPLRVGDLEFASIFATKISESSTIIWLSLGQVTISGQIIMAQEWLCGTKYGSLYERKDKNV